MWAAANDKNSVFLQAGNSKNLYLKSSILSARQFYLIWLKTAKPYVNSIPKIFKRFVLGYVHNQ